MTVLFFRSNSVLLTSLESGGSLQMTRDSVGRVQEWSVVKESIGEDSREREEIERRKSVEP